MANANAEVVVPPNGSSLFDTAHLKVDLKGRSLRGGAATIAGQGARFMIQMGSTMVLARLLTPADFGLIAMVMAITGFADLFKNLGLSTATVQRAEINHDQVSVLFWVNVGISLLIMLVTAALAPVIAVFYGDPRLTVVAVVLSAAFVFGGLTVQHQALLRRHMRFTALAAIEVGSMLCGVAAAIIAARAGAGYWALVIMNLARPIATMLGVWVFCRWWPGWPSRRSGAGTMLRFGANLTAFSLVNYLSRNLDNVLIGRFWGAGPLGFYAKAYGLLMLPMHQINGPVGAVAVPAMSRLQNDHERYRSYYSKALTIIAGLSTPVVIFLLVAADKLVLVLLGGQWVGIAPLFRILGPAALMSATNVAGGWVYVTFGHVNRQLRWAIFSSIVCCLSIGVGLPWGATGVALAVSISHVVLKVPSLWYCYRGTPVRLGDFFGAVWRPAVASVGAGLAVYGLERAFFQACACPAVVALAVLFVVYGILYAVLFCMLPGGRASLGSGLAILKVAFPSRRPQRPAEV